MPSNPISGLFMTFGELLHSLRNVGRHSESENQPLTESSPVLREVLAATGRAYDSTWRAFDTDVDDVSVYDDRDARAKSDAEAAVAAFTQHKEELPPALRSAISALVERVEAAQLQLMAFAINRKNRGEPDAAQVEAELEDRRAFRQECGESIGRLPVAFRDLLLPQ